MLIFELLQVLIKQIIGDWYKSLIPLRIACLVATDQKQGCTNRIKGIQNP